MPAYRTKLREEEVLEAIWGKVVVVIGQSLEEISSSSGNRAITVALS